MNFTCPIPGERFIPGIPILGALLTVNFSVKAGLALGVKHSKVFISASLLSLLLISQPFEDSTL
jgi:hypothetical protein